MRNLCTWGIGVLVVYALLAPAAFARDIYVATTGNDGWPGTSAQPYRNIKTGCSRAAGGDIIHVKAGTYSESWIDVPSGVTLKSEDGLYAAKVFSGGSSGLRFENGVSNSVADGFECYATWNTGSPGDGLLRIYNCSNITIRNMLVHDAPYDCDVIKIGGAGSTTTNIMVENCVVYNPAHRTDGVSYQECIDMYPADHTTLRHCWLYHTSDKGGDVLTFCKGGCTNITWENNVFGPVFGNAGGNPSCMAGGPSPEVFPACTNFIARNNLFLECSGDGAFALIGVQNAEFYNNVIWNYHGARCAVEFYTAKLNWASQNDGFKFFNNIVVQTNGLPVFFDRGIWTADGTYIPKNFTHDNNLYYQVTNSGQGTININAEPNSLFVDPLFSSPSSAVPGTDTWSTIVPRFNLPASSPAINKGYNLGSLVATDINGTSRPQGSAYDMGVYEYVAPNRAPTVDAGADVAAVYENLPVALHATAGDLDGDSLSYAWSQTAGQTALSPAGAATADYSFQTPTLTSRSGGAMTLRVDVSDGHGGSANDSVNVTVYMAGDANHDWFVNVGDLQALVAAWGSQKTPPSANWNASVDFNADSFVNVSDLQALVANWARSL